MGFFSLKQVCSICGDEKYQVFEEVGHDFGDIHVIKEPVGYENGVQITACKVCGTAKMEFIDGFSKGLSYEKTAEKCFLTESGIKYRIKKILQSGEIK